MHSSGFSKVSKPLLARPLWRARLDAPALFSEWEANLLDGSDTETGIVQLDGRVAGFMSVRRIGLLDDIILNGVAPACEGRGVYRSLLRWALREAHERQRDLEVSTQAENVRVQQIWQQEGLRLHRVLATLHLVRKENGSR